MAVAVNTVLAVDPNARLQAVERLVDAGIRMVEIPPGPYTLAALVDVGVPEDEVPDALAGITFFTVTGSPAASGHEVCLPKNLTSDERQLLVLVADGHTNEQIARRMDTTRYHIVSRLRVVNRKLGARSRANAVLLAYRLGILGGGA
ncbi:helix-turn-helix transcriptional regulator [Amycolatopsis lurida]|uniref:helix-turn-helix transcriptional regulator n=1 Tax=Amycolatopsis lurida TaxID=31959 RepID=UPI00365E7D2B